MSENNQAGVFAAEGAKAGAAYEAYFVSFINALKPHEPQQAIQDIAGSAFLAYYSHVLDLVVDKYGIPREGTEEAEQTACASCWCNTCAKRESCDAFPATDGITPPPCAACQREVMSYAEPMIPNTEPPECGYEPESD
jgi:hypothetical protein